MLVGSEASSLVIINYHYLMQVERRGTADQTHRSLEHLATETFSKSKCNVRLVRSLHPISLVKTKAQTILACLNAALWTIETIRVSEVDVNKA